MPYTVPHWLTGSALPWLNEEASIFGKGPLIVTDAVDADGLRAFRAELGSAILIGIDETGALPQNVDVFDILLTTAPSPPRPWVQVHSVADALGTLSAAIKANPVAAVTQAQVLRAQRGLAFETALQIESLAYSALLGGAEFRRWRAATPRAAQAPQEGPAITIAREANTARITLALPDSQNAMTTELRDELVEAFRAVRMDGSIQTVEVRALGRVFCSGGPPDEFGTADDLSLAHHVRTVRSVALALHRLDAHSRVFFQGAAIGSGIEFSAAGRELIAQPSAFFELPELSMGLMPGAGGTVTIARRIGSRRACYMGLSGARLRARTALAWGLIDRIADD